MYDSPISLQESCVEFICYHLEDICEVASSNNNAVTTSQGATSTNRSESPQRLLFRPDAFLHSELSEQLLTTLCDRGKLDDWSLSLFDTSVTRLKRVRLRNVGVDISTRGLRILRGHKLTDLEVTGLVRATVNDLVGCLGEWSLQHLRTLSVSRCTFLDMSKYCVVVALAKLRGLHSLDVSHTEFNRHGLEIVTHDLPQLEALDISGTRVDDITPLRRLKDRLKSLAMYNLRISSCDSVVPILLEMTALQRLDVSDEKDNHPFEMFAPIKSKVSDLLRHQPGLLPKLTHLDISGKEDIESADLRNFVEAHPSLVFLGLIQTEACYDDMFTDVRSPDYKAGLAVTGTASEAQILEALRRYPHRPLYVQKCLYNLFRLTPNFPDARVDVIQLVLPGMAQHPEQFGVQMAATACLYNLTKGDLAQKIHPRVLRSVVDLTLTAMDTFPNHYQLQKNTLLTLCSDRILQDVAFDKYRCARLVMNCLCAFDDASMNRMSVAICSILAAKISTRETSELGAQPHYMRKLLSIVRSKVEVKLVDITMKFTLSALWNLTDESPNTCTVFLKEHGMELFLEVLGAFPGESAVETKVLGLINNIAEVAILRQMLMMDAFISRLRKLLHSTHIDVSYFAAGIIAHLASDGVDQWTVTSVERPILLKELGEVVLQWETPEGEMVAYRSFHPFFPLLACHTAYQVQLWAVWAIQHVCTKNAKRYCPMLVGEGGDMKLRLLLDSPEVHPDVQIISKGILDVLATEGLAQL